MNADQLSAVLQQRFGPEWRCVDVQRGPAGNSQETWFIRAADHAEERELVLRRSAPGGTLTWTDRGLEFALLSALEAAGIPVPHVHWEEGEVSALERPYFVMDRLAGGPVGRDETERRAVAEQIGRTLANLHALDAGTLDVDLDIPATVGDAAREELGRWSDRYARVRDGSTPMLGALLAWLDATAPQDAAPAALLWGDPGPHNVLVSDGVVTGLLDWELSHVGHPLDDLGAAVWACLGVVDPQILVAAYETERGAPVDRATLRWFETLACVTRSVMLLDGVEEYESQRTTRPSSATLGLHLLAENAIRGARAAGWGELPAAAELPQPARSDPPALRPDLPTSVASVARFLSDEVLPAVQDPALRRGIKSAAGLLATAGVRAEHETAISAGRREATAALLDELAAAGVPVSGDLETVADQVETSWPAWQPRMRAHLLADLAVARSVLGPLDRLYGRVWP
jgi:aminoglycoside phosphotransferase (APT) family kinase protein